MRYVPCHLLLVCLLASTPCLADSRSPEQEARRLYWLSTGLQTANASVWAGFLSSMLMESLPVSLAGGAGAFVSITGAGAGHMLTELYYQNKYAELMQRQSEENRTGNLHTRYGIVTVGSLGIAALLVTGQEAAWLVVSTGFAAYVGWNSSKNDARLQSLAESTQKVWAKTWAQLWSSPEGQRQRGLVQALAADASAFLAEEKASPQLLQAFDDWRIRANTTAGLEAFASLSDQAIAEELVVLASQL